MYKLIAFLFILCSVAASFALQVPTNFATKPEDTGSAEAVFRGLKEEVSLWSEEVEKTRKMVGDYNIYCVDLGLELAFGALGPIMPVVLPLVRITWETFEYLSCSFHIGRSDPLCRSRLDALLGFAKDLPAEIRDFSKDYVQVLKDIPAAVARCIHSME